MTWDDLVFGQQHATTGPWFTRLYGQAHSVPVADFPHTRALAGDDDMYLEYLHQSWRYHGRENTEATRRDQLRRLHTGPPGPIRTVQRPDGKHLVVDGNHRAAVGYANGDLPRIQPVDPARWLTSTVSNPSERYGTKPGKPYQSVWYDNIEWVEGRRRDTLTRHQAIDETGVLDLGCNIGAATILAGGHGVDRSPRMVTAAWRLAGFFANPATFDVADLDETIYRADIVFCFAVAAHLDRVDALRATLRNADVVYFEENAGPAQFGKVADLFTHVDELPGERRLYRCET